MDTVDYCDDRKLGQVTFTGIVRLCDEKNRFMPENNVEKKKKKNVLFYVDGNAWSPCRVSLYPVHQTARFRS